MADSRNRVKKPGDTECQRGVPVSGTEIVPGEHAMDVAVKKAAPTSGRIVPGDIAVVGDSVEINTEGLSTLALTTTGTWVGVWIVQGTVDEINWVSLRIYDPTALTVVGAATSNVIGALIEVGGYTKVRFFQAVLSSGSLSVVMSGQSGDNVTQVFSPKPALFFTTADLRDGASSPWLKGQKVMADSMPTTPPVDFLDKFELRSKMAIVPGVTAHDKFGKNLAVGTIAEDVWPIGGLYVYPTGTAQVSVISNNAQDDAAGTGARTVRLEGLDIARNPISEDVALVGNGTVISTLSYIRMQRCYVLTAGTGGENAAPINFIHPGTGLPVAYIDTGDNQTTQALVTVPAGKTAYITSWTNTLDSQKTITYQLKTREPGGVFRARKDFITDQAIFPQFQSFIQVPEKTDITTRAFTTSGAGVVSSIFEYYLVDN